METIQNTLADNLRAWRKDRGMTQEELAEKAGFSVQAVQSIETGKRWPGIETISAIARVLEIPESILFSAAFPTPVTLARKVQPEEALDVLRDFIHKASVKPSPIRARVLDIIGGASDDQLESILTTLEVALEPEGASEPGVPKRAVK